MSSIWRASWALPTASIAALCSQFLWFASYVLFTPAFLEHGLVGPIEPTWLVEPLLVVWLWLAGFGAGFIRAQRTDYADLSGARLGLLVGMIVCAGWLLRKWVAGDPLEWSMASWVLPVLALATSSAALGGYLSARRERDHLR